MKKYEYSVIENHYPNEEDEVLNEAGEEGWELVSIIATSSSSWPRTYFFKRELP